MNTTVDRSFGSTPLGGLQYTLSLSLGTLIVFAIIAYISYTCKRIRDEATIRNRYSLDGDYGVVTSQHKGLDEATLSSFPRFTYSNLKAHNSIASACSVCLADYVDHDLLRLLPHCGHFFHVECIDSWLVIQSTCPICRYSPLAPPASDPV